MVEQHKHCPVCGKPVPLTERYCSQECEYLAAENQKRVAKTRKILYGIFIVFILVWLIFTLRGKLF